MEIEKILDDLETKAKAATPGPWEKHKHCNFVITSDFPRVPMIGSTNMSEDAAYVASANPAVVLRLIEMVRKLKDGLEAAKAIAQTAQEIAEAAWSGEIPSPLPGHESSEEQGLELMEYCNCPYCGGSGHIDDCDDPTQKVTSISLFSKEHYDIIQAFDKLYHKKYRLDKEEKIDWPKGIIYQNGEVNLLFRAFREGVAYGESL